MLSIVKSFYFKKPMLDLEILLNFLNIIFYLCHQPSLHLTLELVFELENDIMSCCHPLAYCLTFTYRL